MAQEPVETLKNRSYLGLLLSQFLAAFNDQATHIVAIFFATDMLVRFVGVEWIDDKAIITLVTACFISPFFFFSPLAGVLADKFSKRTILVFWKVAEVAIMGVALLAFALPHFGGGGFASPQTLAVWSAALAIAVVFLMGTHSAFFVPAKYGIMPELLHPSVLSRGNGLLEGTSFTANILGTTFGGLLYVNLQSHVTSGHLEPGGEWIIGAVLFSLALLGAVGAFLIVPIPASAPERRLDWQPWVPLKANLSVLTKSRSLAVAVVGIAFFTFMTLFLRQNLLAQGETAKELERQQRDLVRAEQMLDQAAGPKLVGDGAVVVGATDLAAANGAIANGDPSHQAELWITLLIGFVGLGVGAGCSLAGHFSGKKLELGLVPIGASFLVATTAALAVAVGRGQSPYGASLMELARTNWSTIVCLVMIGTAAGLYIVPFYTLLQQRAPKGSKGNLVATSNFFNVSGGLLAVAVFWFLTMAIESILGLDLTPRDVAVNPGLRQEYIQQLTTRTQIPRAQFLFASLTTAAMILLLLRQRPDLLMRSLLWMRTFGRDAVHLEGWHNIPADGPVIAVTNFTRLDDYLQLISQTDRFTRVLMMEDAPQEDPRLAIVRTAGRKLGLLAACGLATRDERERSLLAGEKTLQSGYLLGITSPGDDPSSECAKLLAELQRRVPSTIVPVFGARANGEVALSGTSHLATLIIGRPLPPGTPLGEIAAALADLADPAAAPATAA